MKAGEQLWDCSFRLSKRVLAKEKLLQVQCPLYQKGVLGLAGREADMLRVPELSGSVLWLVEACLTSSVATLSPERMTKRAAGLGRELQPSLEVEAEGCWKAPRCLMWGMVCSAGFARRLCCT